MVNNYIEDILNKYESFLQKVLIDECGKHCLEDMFHLYEQRGVIFDLKGICNAMYKSIPTIISNWERQKDGSYTTTVTNINSRGSFLKNVTLNLILVPPDRELQTAAEVDLSNSIFNKNKKLEGVVFYYNDYLTDAFEVNKINFYGPMWHELQHAYRHYQFKLAEVGSKTPRKPFNGEVVNQLHYNRSQKFGGDVSKFFNTRTILYFTDQNEINSHLHEMVPYIEFNNNINFNNYREYLDNIPGYDIVKILKFFASKFYIVEEDEELRNELTRQCRLIFQNDKLTPSQCVYKTRNRLNNSALYAEKQFYKMLNTTLKKFKRKGYYTEMLVRETPKNLIDEMKEILERI